MLRKVRVFLWAFCLFWIAEGDPGSPFHITDGWSKWKKRIFFSRLAEKAVDLVLFILGGTIPKR